MILSLLSRQIHYLTNRVAWYGAYTETLNVELCTYKTLRFSKNCELRHGWPVYNFWGVTRPRSLFFTWLFDRWTLQQILRRSIPKTRNSRKIASGRFFHSGSHITLYLAGSGLPAFQHYTRKTGEPGKSYHVSDVEVNRLNWVWAQYNISGRRQLQFSSCQTESACEKKLQIRRLYPFIVCRLGYTCYVVPMID